MLKNDYINLVLAQQCVFNAKMGTLWRYCISEDMQFKDFSCHRSTQLDSMAERSKALR